MGNKIFLSYFIDEQTPMYGNENFFKTERVKSIKEGDSCNTLRWTFSNHTGTHIDSPYHFSESGKRISDFSPDFWMIKKCQVIDITPIAPGEIICRTYIPLETLSVDIEVLIINTGFDKHRGDKVYWNNNPGLHPELADTFRSKFKQLRIVGIDAISVSPFQNRTMGRETHKAFLENDNHPILLIEDMDLSLIKPTTKISQLFIAPLLVDNADASPCTILAEVNL